MNNLLLRNKTVVVTGAAGGLGAHMMKHFAQLGATVIGLDKKKLQGLGETQVPGARWIQCDLASSNIIASTVKEINTMTSSIEILINCAGAFAPDPPIEEVRDTLRSLWEANVVTAVQTTLALRTLLESGHAPLVVNVASTDAIVASAGQDCEVGVAHDLLYATVKGSLISFTRALAMGWAPLKIRVNAVCPTLFESPMTDELLKLPGKREQLSRHIPLRRLCTTEDVAVTIESLYRLVMTTGHIIPIDGGYLCQ